MDHFKDALLAFAGFVAGIAIGAIAIALGAAALLSMIVDQLR